ncbi:MAG: PRC-barrel domain-containing protein [Candidatus Saccharibacteria bacterium]|nr:PRC-barrel domain-containing protein [Candidatus Saccharibacteria bacterium]
MLITADRFLQMPVMSLQTGSELARTVGEVIDPRDLTIVAYELTGPLLDQDPTLLLVRDIREIGALGAIINSSDELIAPSDVVRIKEIYDFQFQLRGKPVVDQRRKKIGKVVGYTIEAGHFTIQQLQVKRPLFKSFSDTEILVHRSQITKVTDDFVMVKSATVAHQVKPQQITGLPAYDNPFRSQPESESEPDAA